LILEVWSDEQPEDPDRLACAILALIERVKPLGWEPVFDERLHAVRFKLHTVESIKAARQMARRRNPLAQDQRDGIRVDDYVFTDWKLTRAVLERLLVYIGQDNRF
jgi:hypothetical protein